MDCPQPLPCAVFLTAAFVLAGCTQTVWFRSRLSTPFRVPIDGRRSIGGKRIFGDNKTWSGFVVMVPAVGAAFGVLGLLRPLLPFQWRDGLWPLPPVDYGLLGCVVGFGFMAAELPNSFLKRRLGVEPGAAPANPLARWTCFVIDRTDSIIGGFLALALFVPVSFLTWVYVLLVGSGLHWSFSVLLYHLGVKARPA